MGAYLFKRAAIALATVIAACFFTFVLMRIVPGEPASVIIRHVFLQDQTAAVDQRDVAALAVQYGLNDPWIVQFGRWFVRAIQGDLGISVRSRRPISVELGWRMANSGLLAGLATLVSLVLTFSLAAAGRLFSATGVKASIAALCIGSIAIPAFYLGVILIIVFSLQLDLLPISGFLTWSHVILPVAVLALGQFGFNVAILSGALEETYAAPYIVTARAKGLSSRDVFFRHALRNALTPFIPYLGLQTAFLVGGVLVVEQLFGVPGVGAYLMTSLDVHDAPAFLGTVGLIAATVALCNFLADLALAFVDPRVRLVKDRA